MFCLLFYYWEDCMKQYMLCLLFIIEDCIIYCFMVIFISGRNSTWICFFEVTGKQYKLALHGDWEIIWSTPDTYFNPNQLINFYNRRVIYSLRILHGCINGMWFGLFMFGWPCVEYCLKPHASLSKLLRIKCLIVNVHFKVGGPQSWGYLTKILDLISNETGCPL